MSFLARRATTAVAPRLMAGATTRAFSASARRDVARMTLIGNLAATPEIRPTSGGKEIIEYSIASNSGSGDKQHTSWFRVATFAEEGARRDFLISLPKGATVYVEADAVMNTYLDAEGNKKTGLSIYQRNLQVLRRPAHNDAPQE